MSKGNKRIAFVLYFLDFFRNQLIKGVIENSRKVGKKEDEIYKLQKEIAEIQAENKVAESYIGKL